MNTDLYLIRHGQPELQNALLGSTDSPLNDLGWQQLAQTFSSLGDIEQLISSPLKRCADFAKHYATEQNIQCRLQIEDNLRECHFGDWDGKTFDFLHQKYAQDSLQFFNDPDNNCPPNAEKLKDFSARVENAIKLLHAQHEGKRITLLTHAGVIRTLVAWCLKMDYSSGLQFSQFAVDYASVTHISIYNDSQQLFPRLISLNGRITA